MSDVSVVVPSEELLSAARRLADYNVRYEPALHRIYLFPHAEEIRLIEVDPTAIPRGEVRPYYFREDPEGGIPFRSAIALITPEEDQALDLPEGWGSWSDAITLHPESN